MKFYVKIIRVLFTIFFLLFFFTCKPQVNHRASSFTLPLTQEVDSIDPVLTTDEATGSIVSLLFDRLYKVTPSGSIVKNLVLHESYSKNKVRLKLLDNLFFTDGLTSLTEADVVFSLNRLRLKGRHSWILEKVKSIHRVGTNLIEFTMIESARKVWGMQRSLLSMPQCAIYSKQSYTDNKVFLGHSSWKLQNLNSDRVFLKAIDKSSLDIEWRIIRDASSGWFFFKKSMFDLFKADGVFKFLPYDKKEFIRQEIKQLTVLYGAIVAPNNRHSILSDNKFRRTVNFRIDRKNLVEKVLSNGYYAADYPVPDVLAQAPNEYYLFNENKSYASTSDERIMIYSPPDRDRQNVARVISDVINKMGFQSSVKVFDLSTVLKMNNDGVAGIYVLKWVADYPHASNFLMPLFHSKNSGAGGNRAHFHSVAIDKALESTRYTADEVIEIQKKIRLQAPWVFIGFAQSVYYLRRSAQIKIPLTYSAWSRDVFSKKD